MSNLQHDEKIEMMRALNWDYSDNYEEMLEVIEGKRETSGALSRNKLFSRSLERLPWHHVVALWGVDKIRELYTEEIARSIWPKERRRHFDFALSVLRGNPLPVTGWGVEYYTSKRHRFFLNRGNSTKQGIL